jgi:Protein of unknown function (DUF3318)
MRELDTEIRRLLDIMPATGRMLTRIISKPEQGKVIDYKFPLPWQQNRPIYINFDLWKRLKRPERDLLLLRGVSWLINIKWFKPDIYKGLAILGTGSGIVQIIQSDVTGALIGFGLTAVAIQQVLRQNSSSEYELIADQEAIKTAIRRGYTEVESAQYLLGAIEAIAIIEGRGSLNFVELIRCQNLRAISGISPLGAPDSSGL